MEQDAATRTGRLIGMAVFGLVVVVGAWVLLTGPDDPDPYRPSPADAERMCRQDVLRDLKAPGSASFGDIEVALDGPDRYTVAGWVDAENSFGAEVRSDWTCDAVHEGGGEWRTKVSIDG